MAAWTYDPATGQYHDAEGDRLAEATVSALLLAALAASRARVEARTARLVAGTLDREPWLDGLEAEIAASQVAAAALAHGGLAQLDPATRAILATALTTQAGYLAGFVAALASGQQPLDGTVAGRAGQYIGAAWTTFQEVRRDDHATRGDTHERNVLEPGAAHCDGCLEADRAGWQPIGSLPLPGNRDCLHRCQCSLELGPDPNAREPARARETRV